jgi:hypothetical protein
MKDLPELLSAAMQAHTSTVTLRADAARDALRSARRVRHGQAAGAVAAVGVIGAAVTASAVMLPSGSGGTGTGLPAAPGHSKSAHPSSSRPSAAEPSLATHATVALFPASGSDTRWQSSFGAFRRKAIYQKAQPCFRRHGVFAPPTPTSLPPAHIEDMPDLDYLAKHGFSPGIKAPAPGSRSADVADSQLRCVQQAGTALFGDLDNTVGPLRSRWLTAARPADSNPRVQAAYRNVPACFQQHGIPVDSEDEFFTYADSHLDRPHQRGRGEQARHEEDIRLAGIYAQCMRHVVAVRSDVRSELRAKFLAAHSAAVKQVKSALLRAAWHAESVTGMQYQPPVER